MSRGTVGDDEQSAAILRNEARVAATREHVYASALSREQAAQRAGVKPDHVTRLLRDGHLVALDGSDGLRLPVWQFDAKARLGWLDGIAPVAAAFPGRELSLSSWMVVPNASLGGRTPCQALLDGNAELVAAVAAHHSA